MAAPTIVHNNYGDTLKAVLAKHLPEEDQKVTFRLKQAAAIMEALNNDNRVFTLNRLPSFIHLKREEKIIDPDSGATVLLSYVTGYSPKDGHMVPDIPPLFFRGNEGGILEVGRDQPELLARLLLSDQNENSPNSRARKPEGGYLYEIVKPDADARKKYDRVRAIMEALQLVDDLSDDDLKSVSGKLNLPTMEHSRHLTNDELRHKLAELAQAEPDRVESVIDAGERRLEKTIVEAEAAELIYFNEDAQEWRWKATQQAITVAVQGYKPVGALVAYIQQNPAGPDFSQLLKKQVEKAKREKPKRGGKTQTPAQP